MTAGTDWFIYYPYEHSKPTSIDACAAVLSSIVGSPITTDIGPMNGNPRDFYVRTVRLMCDARDDVQVIFLMSQDMRGTDDPETITRLTNVQFRGPMSATRTVLWDRIRDALVPLGYTDPELTEMEVVLAAAPSPPPRDALLDAVIGHPDDDASRRRYADARLAVGDVYGEFIHVQCDLARGGLSRERAIQHRRRERELLADHAKRWTQGLFGLVRELRFSRGFVHELDVDATAWAKHDKAIVAAAPLLRAVMLGDLLEPASDRGAAHATTMVLGRLRRALATPALRKLAGVGLRFVGYSGRETPWDMHEMTSLGERAMRLLVDAKLDQLRALAIETPTPEGAAILAAWPVLAQLEAVSITGLDEPGAILEALEPSRIVRVELDDWYPQLARIPMLAELSIVESSRPVPASVPRVRRLAYQRRSDTAMTVDDVTAIASPGLVELDLQAHQLPGWRALEHAPLDNLRVLRLVSHDLGIDQLRELCTWPIARRLEVLQVTGASDDELVELSAQCGCLVETARVEAPSVLGRTSS